jgi:hypothetical protein
MYLLAVTVRSIITEYYLSIACILSISFVICMLVITV